ncbi:MAG: glycerophosphoryl diester phosphodiesterase membrane domain-containing protein [Gaiellaceae bacterium]
MNPTSGVIGEAWETFKAHWRHLVPIALVVYVAVALISLVLVLLLTWFGAILSFIISLIALFWVQGALVRAVEDIRDGRADMSLGETYQRVRPQLPAIIVGGLLAGLGIALGLVLLIVPGLILLTWWIVLIPVIVLEERSAGEAFGRSRELVRGHAWSVFGVIVLTILVVIAFNIVLSLLLLPVSDWLRSFLSNIIIGTVVTPFVVVTWTTLYYRLRAAKEPPAEAPAAPA